jgi:hypothetical protein
MQYEESAPNPVQPAANPGVDRQEFMRLTRRYRQLAHSPKAVDQKERASLNKTLMSMYRALNPKSLHSWYEDFDVVLRQMRRI